MSKEHAVQYLPPQRRMELRQYLSRSSIKFKQRAGFAEKDMVCKPPLYLS
jgi:hypothetical protein